MSLIDQEKGGCFLRLLKNDNMRRPYYTIYGISYPERFRVQKFFYDVNDKEKISVLKLTKMDKMEDFHKYDIGEDISKPGVYLSKE